MHIPPTRVSEIIFAAEPYIQWGGAGPDAAPPISLTLTLTCNHRARHATVQHATTYLKTLKLAPPPRPLVLQLKVLGV